MRKAKVHGYKSARYVAHVILGLVFLTCAAPAAATLYTYTSADLGYPQGTMQIDENPLRGCNYLTVQFSYDGALPTSGSLPVLFTMTSGGVTLWSGEWDQLTLNRNAETGALTWDIRLVLWWPTGFEKYIFRTSRGAGGDASEMSSVSYMSPYWEQYAYRQVDGTRALGRWDVSTVPAPATVLLLGSGLIPLAWARRRKRLGK